ncbi:PREDICTED: survival of motor neuron-related-splicing factor 30-like [Priapulus caudatus]|uniref:Survival of motor neuron-related-splicing factor 30 n=1 Tax=Priapulus caudatus TaxID=37621 RepID=A0ABM1DUV8_PRICU|nr:PREDICTED: survival of motor neuron-related-splicing factor 30-like [Priapulus caudatus]
MAEEDLAGNLANYQVQLAQVEAALMNDADNEDLLKLQKDLQEVIDLTSDLVTNKVDAVAPSVAEETPELSSTATTTNVSVPAVYVAADAPSWRPGDQCIAQWSHDGGWYEAEVDEITESGDCTVTFAEYGNTDLTKVTLLRPSEAAHGQKNADGRPKSKKDIIADQKEYKRKKAQKKAARMKEMEEEREKEKGKWQDFNSKTFGKGHKKGMVKKSIFATPDSVTGRVGVGTCGVGGKPMTKYTQLEKWKK